MRKCLLLVAAVPLILAPPAFAGDKKKAERPSVCRAPDIDLGYDVETFTASVSLPASGCRTREHTMFELSVAISRIENHGADRDLVQRSTVCGPFRSADDFEESDAPEYFCNLAVFLAHPETETAEYSVDVTYPAASDTQTMSVFTFCTSDGKAGSCEE